MTMYLACNELNTWKKFVVSVTKLVWAATDRIGGGHQLQDQTRKYTLTFT